MIERKSTQPCSRACGNCKNYHPIKKDWGECHAHLPVFIDMGFGGSRGAWPPVEPHEWCGEFKGKEC